MIKADHANGRRTTLAPVTYALALTGAALFSAVMLLSQPRIILVFAAASGCMAVLAYKRKLHSVFALLLFFTLFEAETLYAPIWSLWPLYLLAPFAAWLLTLYLLRDFGETSDWFKRGRLNKATLGLGILTVLGSSTALWIWAQSHHAYLQSKAHLFPHFSGFLLVSAGCVFAIMNAICEETLFRGIVYGALADSLRNRPVSLILQALILVLPITGEYPEAPAACSLHVSMDYSSD